MTGGAAGPRRALLTGGTGFIGTNLTDALLAAGREVLVIARRPPRHQPHRRCFVEADVLDRDRLRRIVRDFGPTDIVHLAAQTDFVTWEDADGFRVNTEGTANVIRVAEEMPTVERFVFASSHVVAGRRPTGRRVYADSKRAGEEIVRGRPPHGPVWTIVRPCSIWGPWFGPPFRPFFLAIARGRYFHPGRVDPPKRTGFVGNICHQVIRLLDAPAPAVAGRTIYLADYEPIRIREWAELIARRMGRPILRTLPEPAVRAGALAGDLLQRLGVRNPPLSSHRLANMRLDTSDIPIDDIARIAGRLPFTLERGVDATVRWLRESRLVA
ncbi:MAG TPA: NAD(P)-dependent oxidoreductase [Gemmataceae bacterium]|jgi:nucleoside-diphosphate-sugar epimerase|nr:NAD(P)-dependent oxidoreductase [Gemmataceae bacterium]